MNPRSATGSTSRLQRHLPSLPGLQHLLGGPGGRPPGPGPASGRHPAGHHQRRLQRAGLRRCRPAAHPRGGRQSAPDRAAGTEARRHPAPGLRRFLRPVRPGRSPRTSATSTATPCAPDLSPFAQALLGRTQHWFAQRRSGGLLFPGAGRHRGARLPRLSARAPAPGATASTDLFQASIAGRPARASTTPGSEPLLWGPGDELDPVAPAHHEHARRALCPAPPGPGPARRRGRGLHPRGASSTSSASCRSATNYFWTVYLRGAYTARVLPRVPQARELRGPQGRAGRPHQSRTPATVTAFLQRTRRAHLQVRAARPHGLDGDPTTRRPWPRNGRRSWPRATPDARVIFRSAHADPRYLDLIARGPRAADRGLSDLLLPPRPGATICTRRTGCTPTPASTSPTCRPA